MPAKKTVKTEEATAKKTTTKKAKAVKEEAVKEEKPAKKTAAKKTATKKAATKKAETVEKEAAPKKAATKKAAATKKTAEKKPAAKKTTAKKTTAKKAAVKKVEEPEVIKKSVKDYEDVINWKKGEAHAMDWLYIEINAGDLLTEVEAGVDNLSATCEAILNCMLEGDGYIVEPSEADKVSAELTVRYYCDNLSEDRKKYFDR